MVIRMGSRSAAAAAPMARSSINSRPDKPHERRAHPIGAGQCLAPQPFAVAHHVAPPASMLA